MPAIFQTSTFVLPDAATGVDLAKARYDARRTVTLGDIIAKSRSAHERWREDVNAVISRKPGLGLVVGVGFGAGVFYYKRIATALGEGSPGGLMLAHANLRKVLDPVGDGNMAGLTEYMNTLIAALANAGPTYLRFLRSRRTPAYRN